MSTLKSLRSDFKSVVEFAKMDLAERPYPLGCGCSPASSNKKYYPTLYVNRQDKIDLPMKGKATIEYRLRSKTARQDEDGKMTESADIEVISIDPVVEPAVKPKPGAAVPTVVAQFRSDFREIVEFASGDGYAKLITGVIERYGKREPMARVKVGYPTPSGMRSPGGTSHWPKGTETWAKPKGSNKALKIAGGAAAVGGGLLLARAVAKRREESKRAR